MGLINLNNDPYGILDKLLHTKFVDWEHEKEMRMIVAKSECEKRGNFWFNKFDDSMILKEVYLGEKCPKSITDYRQLLKAEGYSPNVQIMQARPAFGKYEYEIDKRFL
ncbi:hypothetical protein [Pseudovibrio sp. Ad37]|uniref:hypothetical protein n=1 Tax=Pseudovibrio sp. Ad37 TaxID=989422 RepID=UPI0007AE46E1|nr:hypothetical protein [Pseudovibrio sp. Ad37]KZL21113.1 hypothetical protein PsAD37_03520 [Pseudovibrio sp. Ad37]